VKLITALTNQFVGKTKQTPISLERTEHHMIRYINMLTWKTFNTIPDNDYLRAFQEYFRNNDTFIFDRIKNLEETDSNSESIYKQIGKLTINDLNGLDLGSYKIMENLEDYNKMRAIKTYFIQFGVIRLPILSGYDVYNYPYHYLDSYNIKYFAKKLLYLLKNINKVKELINEKLKTEKSIIESPKTEPPKTEEEIKNEQLSDLLKLRFDSTHQIYYYYSVVYDYLDNIFDDNKLQFRSEHIIVEDVE
jgi:hypothetical protein